MKNVKLEDLTNYITINLKITESFLANLIGTTPASIQSQKSFIFEDVSKSVIGRRIGLLFYAVHHYVGLALSNDVMMECLRNPCYEDIKENMDSVISAIQQDKYNGDTLLLIANIAYSEQLKKIEAKDDIFPTVRELLTV